MTSKLNRSAECFALELKVETKRQGLDQAEHLTRAGTSEEVTSRLALPWILRLRYGLVAIEAAILAVACFGLGAKHVIVAGSLVIVIMALTNVFHRALQSILGVAFDQLIAGLFCFDILSLTGIFMLTGGASNPFSLLYLVQITL